MAHVNMTGCRRSLMQPSGWLAAMVLLTLSACDDPMANQPHHEPLERSAFYADQRASRHTVEGTVARGQLDDDRYLTDYRGPDDPLPIDVSLATLERGRERFEINCIMCHGGAGDGRGIVPARGYTTPTSYHIDRLREAPLSHFVRVMEKGAGNMPSYAAQVAPRDRWAIALYIRALQLSQHAPASALSPEDLEAIETGAAAAANETPESSEP